MSPTPLLRLYYAFARWPAPWVTRRLLNWRAARGKEDPQRLGERLGVAGRARPEGPLVWLHAASVGESVSMLPLVEALTRSRPDLTCLLTSGTVTSAKLMARRLPAGVIHQYAPLDTFEAVGRFLDHWRPDFLGVAESEIWPVMLSETRRRGARTALVSARLSERSARSWRRAPKVIAALLEQFDLILAQNQTVAERLLGVGAPSARLSAPGSLKSAAAPLPVDEAELAAWRARLGGRPIWLAASTHEGEERAAMEAHVALAARAPDMLTVIAPRHPDRADAVARELREAGLTVARRSQGETPTAQTQVFLVDVLGELGLWFRLSPVVFVGGTLAPIGGHNPLEPARLGAAVLFGPAIETVVDDCRRLEEGGAALKVTPAAEQSPGAALAETLSRCFGPDGKPTRQAREMGARAVALTRDDGVLSRILAALEPLLPPPPARQPEEADGARA